MCRQVSGSIFMKLHNLYHHFHKQLIEPRSKDPNVQNQEAVLNWLLVGSLGLAIMAFVNDLFSLVALRDKYILGRLLIIAGVFICFGLLLMLSRRGQRLREPSIVLVSLLFAAALSVVYQWGILAPTGILLFSLVIIIAGILLSAASSLYLAFVTVLVLSGLEYAKAHHYLSPNLAWERRPSSLTDVAGFTAIYAILALSSWLFNRRMEMALSRAKRSEQALKRQRDLLEVKVEQRTRALQAAQLEQVQQVYRFAELGHLSTALFHDLANHVMSVSIDIEGLQKRPGADILGRIQDNVHHIDEVVQRVRRQIRGQGESERFDVLSEIQEVVKMLAYFSSEREVSIELQSPSGRRAVTYRGDLTRFRQVMVNLLSNAIEAYRQAGRGQDGRVVTVAIARLPAMLTISVADRGQGIKPAVQAKIFEPFYSTKDKGMGIGLFIVKKVVEEDFGGTISVKSSEGAGTTFVVTLPAGTHGRSGAKTRR